MNKVRNRRNLGLLFIILFIIKCTPETKSKPPIDITLEKQPEQISIISEADSVEKLASTV